MVRLLRKLGYSGANCRRNVILIVAATVIVATDASKNITSEMAVWFDLVLCVGSFFVHYPTFLKYATVDPKVTMCLCIVIPTISWVSLYFYRHSKNTPIVTD